MLFCEDNSFKKFAKKGGGGQKPKLVKCRKCFRFLFWTLVFVARQHVVNITYCTSASRVRLECKSQLHTQAGCIPQLLRTPLAHSQDGDNNNTNYVELYLIATRCQGLRWCLTHWKQ